jgi:hypothetical protein
MLHLLHAARRHVGLAALAVSLRSTQLKTLLVLGSCCTCCTPLAATWGSLL